MNRKPGSWLRGKANDLHGGGPELDTQCNTEWQSRARKTAQLDKACALLWAHSRCELGPHHTEGSFAAMVSFSLSFHLCLCLSN